MPKLTEDVQTFIVQQLACFDTPQQVADAVKDSFGVEIPRQQVENYDPTKRPKIAEKWRAIHAAARARFLADASEVPIAHRSYRLRELDRLYRKASSGARPNIVLAKDLLVEAEKFAGDVYTNRPRASDVPPESEDARIARLKAALTEMRARTLGGDTKGDVAASGAPLGPRAVEDAA